MTEVVRAKLQRPVIEVLEETGNTVTFRKRVDFGVMLVHRHYLGCDYFEDVIYLSDDGFLNVYHVNDETDEDYLKVYLDRETAEQIRREIMSAKTFEDFARLMDMLLKATFCDAGHDKYRICK
jgi:hypothetical protein